ncbi:hypothetical protein Tco_1470139, partial [Tanacetum coccineum]
NNQGMLLKISHVAVRIVIPILAGDYRVFDDEGVQASELIGCGQVAIKDLEPGKVKDIWIKLVKDLDIQRDNKKRGQGAMGKILIYSDMGKESIVFMLTCIWSSCTVLLAQDNGFLNSFNSDFRLTDLEKAFKSGISENDANRTTLSEQKRKEVIRRQVLFVAVTSAKIYLPSIL